MIINEKKYVVTDPKVHGYYKYVCLSDIHSNYNNLLAAIDRIMEIKPDFVVIAGDLIDMLDNPNNRSLIEPISFLNSIIPVYVGFGNSDVTFRYRQHNDSYFYQGLKNNGVNVLGNNSSSIFKNILITSLNIDKNRWYSFNETKDEFDKLLVTKSRQLRDFNMLICHSPNPLIEDNHLRSFVSENLNNTIINSGHTHGGLVPTKLQKVIKSRKGLIGPNGNVRPSNSFGFYNDNSTTLIISDGVTKIAPSKKMNDDIRNIINNMYGISIDVIEIRPNLIHSCIEEDIKKIRVR